MLRMRRRNSSSPAMASLSKSGSTAQLTGSDAISLRDREGCRSTDDPVAMDDSPANAGVHETVLTESGQADQME